MEYTISEAAKITGFTSHTLRFYDRAGLLPFVDRSATGIRIFKDSDFEWLNLINCLKNTGMQIKDIAQFINMCMEGDSTLEARLTLFREHKKVAEQHMIEAQKNLDKINYKIWYYETAVKAGTEKVHDKQNAHSG